MKNISLFLICFIACLAVAAQDFNKDLAVARTAYKSGKLDDSRFAMEQMMQELDMITGKEILKLLPDKMLDQSSNKSKDNVTGASGFAGVIIHRDYGAANKNVALDIITNSPLLGTLNALLAVPFIANNGDQKVIKINGYKALVQKVNGENNAVNYELQLPLTTSLVTLKAPGFSQDDVIKMANTLPVSDIVKIIQ